MNPPTQAGASQARQGKPKKGNGITHAVAARRLRPRADRRDRRPRLRRARGDGRRRRDGARRRLGRRARAGLDRRDHRGPSSRARSPSASASTTSTCSVYRVDPDAAKLVTPAAIKRYQAVPVSFAGDRTLLVAMADPANVLAVDDIAVMTGYEVRPAVASPADIEFVLERLDDPSWGNGDGAAPELEPLDEPELRGPPPSRRRPALRPRRRRPSTSAPPARTPRSSSSCSA